MSEPTLETEFPLESLVIPPLDAYLTAKPGEPTFSLQGGDPLASPLIELWIRAKRGSTGLRVDFDQPLERLRHAMLVAAVTGSRAVEDTLRRASSAEEVLWTFRDYLAGRSVAEERKPAAKKSSSELQRLDLHDLRVRTAQKLSNAGCEMLELLDALQVMGYDEMMLRRIRNLSRDLRHLSNAIEPRRTVQRP